MRLDDVISNRAAELAYQGAHSICKDGEVPQAITTTWFLLADGSVLIVESDKPFIIDTNFISARIMTDAEYRESLQNVKSKHS